MRTIPVVRELGSRVDATPPGLRYYEHNPPSVLQPLVALNTRWIGFGGVALTIVSVVILAQPSLAAALHVAPGLSTTGAIVGAVAALLGRWRTFFD